MVIVTTNGERWGVGVQVKCQRLGIRMAIYSLAAWLKREREWNNFSEIMRGTYFQSRILYPANLIQVWEYTQNIFRWFSRTYFPLFFKGTYIGFGPSIAASPEKYTMRACWLQTIMFSHSLGKLNYNQLFYKGCCNNNYN